ncbi:MAG: DUF6314 family protein [Paracoccaceae bacterium]
MRDLNDFTGNWDLTREIVDFTGGPVARLIGQAVIRAGIGPQGQPGLWFAEDGWLTLADYAPIRATRRYFWQAGAGGIAVSFDDGRPFHSFDPAVDHPEAAHDCAPDHYHVRYDFSAWPNWRADWRVRGPAKDYESRSRFARAA